MIIGDKFQKTGEHFSVVLNGEIGGTKLSAENLFSLPICVIMKFTESLPPRGHPQANAVARGA